MRIEQATIPLAPRTTVNCLDLAVMYYGRHLREMLAIWAVVAVPSCAIVLVASRWFEINLLLPLVVVFLMTGIEGVLVGLAAVPSTFGESLSLDHLRRRWKAQGWPLLFKAVLYRLGIGVGLMLCVFPGVWAALQTGFFIEQACLQRLDRRLHDRRTADLIKEEAVELIVRACGILVFCGLIWICVFLLADVASSILFNMPILLGRLFAGGGAYLSGELLAALLFHDPRVLTTATATALAVYPVGRLAWFFCYVDVRVRRDCWDMELLFAREARRLEVV
jgi:hypothetical protein